MGAVYQAGTAVGSITGYLLHDGDAGELTIDERFGDGNLAATDISCDDIFVCNTCPSGLGETGEQYILGSDRRHRERTVVGTLRSQNECKDCKYTWYPRGKNLSRACPNCGGANVAVVSNAGHLSVVVLVALIGLFFYFGGSGSIPAPTAQAPEPAPVNSPTSQSPALQQEVIVKPPAAQTLVEKEAPTTSAVEAPELAPASAATADDFERIYSEDEIAALEDQMQYRGSDPIVRFRLGLPSRETGKLIRQVERGAP